MRYATEEDLSRLEFSVDPYKGKGKEKPVEVNGKEYKSRKAAAEALNVTSPAVGHWLRSGKNGAKYLTKK